MPTVPTSGGPQVQSRGIALVPQDASRATADVFGAAQGRALEQGGRTLGQFADEVGRLALKTQIEDNEREAKRLDIEMSSAIRETVYGDGTTENPGFYSQKGENALAGREAAIKRINDRRRELLEGTSNPRVKEMFGLAAEQRISQEMANIAKHVGSERISANVATSQARIQEAADDASANFKDPTVLGRALSVTAAENASLAEQNGWSPEVRAAKLSEANSIVLQGVIKQAVAAEDPDTAKAVFDKYAPGMTTSVRVQAAASLREAGLAKISQGLRDEALRRFPNDPVKGMKWIQDNADGKGEEEAVQALSRYYSMVHSADAASRAATSFAQSQADREFELNKRVRTEAEHAANVAWTQQERDRTLRIRAAKDKGWTAIEAGQSIDKVLTPEEKTDIDGATMQQMRVREAQKASGKPIVTDDTAFDRYTNMTADQLQEVDLGLARTKLADPQYTKVENMVVAARQGRLDPKDPQSTPAMAQGAVEELGLTGKDKEKERGMFKRMFMEEIDTAEKAKGKALTFGEKQDILKKFVDEVTVNRRFPIGGFAIPGTSRTDKAFNTPIPSTDRDAIIKSLVKRGVANPSEFQIRRIYLEGLSRKRAGE